MTDQKNKQHQQPQKDGKQNGNPSGKTPRAPQSKDSQHDKSSRMRDSGDEMERDSDVDADESNKKTQIDDRPEETKKKIPNMQNKH